MINKVNPAFTGSITVVERVQNRIGEPVTQRTTYSTNGLKFMSDSEDPDMTYVFSPGAPEADEYECNYDKFEQAFCEAENKNQNIVIDLRASEGGILG